MSGLDKFRRLITVDADSKLYRNVYSVVAEFSPFYLDEVRSLELVALRAHLVKTVIIGEVQEDTDA